MPGAVKTKKNMPISEEIAELQRKIALLDGDRKAYYESSQWTMKQNRETISKMRKENKILHRKLAESKAGDERVINVAFDNHTVERAALRGKSGKEVILVMDQKVCEAMKLLNAEKSKTKLIEKKYVEHETQLSQMRKDAADSESLADGTSDEAMTLRSLENRLDKAVLKLNEAEHINRTYHSIQDQMIKDSLTFGNDLDSLEAEIERQKQELAELQAMNRDAQISRDAAKTELAKHEETVYRERREREEALAVLKKQAEEKKAHAERVEQRRLQRSSLQQDEPTLEQKQLISGVDQEKRISTYEEAFLTIKEATGVSDLEEVVLRFESQGDTTKHLQELKEGGEKQLVRLTEDKAKLQQEFEEMKYSGEAKLSSGQRMLEEFESHLKTEEDRRDNSKTKLDKCSKILVSVKSGVEHLADKLQHLKASKGHVPQAQLSPDSDEFVLDLLSTCEEKLLTLMEELGDKDIEETLVVMEQEEYHVAHETNIPQHNTRIKLPTTHRDNVYDVVDSADYLRFIDECYDDFTPGKHADEEDSGEDEDIVTRDKLKKQAQSIVDSKTKKHKVRSRKKKTIAK